MKKILIVLALALLLSSTASYAHVISFNPIYALFKYTIIDYELPVLDWMGLEFSGMYRAFDLKDWNYTAYGIGLMPKFYFKGTCPSGPWWGPAAIYTNATLRYKPTDGTGSAYTMAAGLMTGYRWVFGENAKEGFIIELGAGYFMAGLPDIEVDGETWQSEGTLSGLVLKFDIGWAF